MRNSEEGLSETTHDFGIPKETLLVEYLIAGIFTLMSSRLDSKSTNEERDAH